MDVHREIWDFEHQDQQKLARMSNAELEKLTVEIYRSARKRSTDNQGLQTTISPDFTGTKGF
jgi:hypothetical protein